MDKNEYRSILTEDYLILENGELPTPRAVSHLMPEQIAVMNVQTHLTSDPAKD